MSVTICPDCHQPWQPPAGTHKGTACPPCRQKQHAAKTAQAYRDGKRVSVCPDCGEEFMVGSKNRHPAPRCPECRKAAKKAHNANRKGAGVGALGGKITAREAARIEAIGRVDLAERQGDLQTALIIAAENGLTYTEARLRRELGSKTSHASQKRLEIAY